MSDKTKFRLLLLIIAVVVLFSIYQYMGLRAEAKVLREARDMALAAVDDALDKVKAAATAKVADDTRHTEELKRADETVVSLNKQISASRQKVMALANETLRLGVALSAALEDDEAISDDLADRVNALAAEVAPQYLGAAIYAVTEDDFDANRPAILAAQFGLEATRSLWIERQLWGAERTELGLQLVAEQGKTAEEVRKGVSWAQNVAECENGLDTCNDALIKYDGLRTADSALISNYEKQLLWSWIPKFAVSVVCGVSLSGAGADCIAGPSVSWTF